MAERYHDIKNNQELLIQLDYIMAKGKLSRRMDGEEPVSYTHLDVYKRQVNKLIKSDIKRGTINLGDHNYVPFSPDFS